MSARNDEPEESPANQVSNNNIIPTTNNTASNMSLHNMSSSSSGGGGGVGTAGASASLPAASSNNNNNNIMIVVPQCSTTSQQQQQLQLLQHHQHHQNHHQPSPSTISNYQAALTDRIGYLFDSDIFADVTFIVGEGTSSRRFRAHKLILAISSPVFSAMFYGTIKCDEEPIAIVDCKPEAFRILLQFAYKNELSVCEVQLALDVLYAARKYSMRLLEDECMVYLCGNVSFDSVLAVKEAAEKYQLPGLESICKEYVEEHSYEVLKYHFPYMNTEMLLDFLRNDRLNIREIDLFNIVLDWADLECERVHIIEPTGENRREMLGPCLSYLRFPTMTATEFADHVVPTEILNVTEIAHILTYISATDKTLNYIAPPFPTTPRLLIRSPAVIFSNNKNHAQAPTHHTNNFNNNDLSSSNGSGSTLLPSSSTTQNAFPTGGRSRGYHRSKKRSRNNRL